jgi:hypothetical protein
MNAKRCKKIRKMLAKTDLVRVEIVMKYTLIDIEFKRERGKIPTTFKYPNGSFQRVYRDIKRNK